MTAAAAELGQPCHALLSTDDGEAWNEALAGMQYSFGHTREACRAFSLATGHETGLFVCSTSAFKTVCPLATRSYRGRVDVFTPPGFSGFATVGNASGFDALWQAIGAGAGWVCAYVQEHPLLHSPFAVRRTGPDARVAYVLDLAAEDDALLAGMSQGRRRQLKRRLAPGVSIARAERSPLPFLQAHSVPFYEARSADRLAIPSDAAWAEILGSEKAIVVEARIDGEVQAVSVFGGSGSVADYLYNVSGPAGQPYSAQLIWAAVPLLRDAGYRRLNLGGGIRPDDSIAEFKRRFGALQLPIVIHRHVFDEQAYMQLSGSGSPPAAGGFFPAYHRQG